MRYFKGVLRDGRSFMVAGSGNRDAGNRKRGIMRILRNCVRQPKSGCHEIQTVMK